MSAFIVSDVHLNYLISFAADRRETCSSTPWGGGVRRYEQEAFEVLYAANVESVNARYREQTPTKTTSRFEYRRDMVPLHVIKASHCFDYQACEVPDYENTPAARLIEAIKVAAIMALPGYDDSDWEIRCLEEAEECV